MGCSAAAEAIPLEWKVMEIVEGFIAVLLPFMVAICPKEDHWVVKNLRRNKGATGER